MTTAFVFPGQGSWDPDVLQAWAAHPAAAVIDRVAERAGVDLWDLPEDAGERTALAQPAILAASLAAHRALTEAGASPDVVAGHSLGEATAAVAAGALELGDGARLVAERGRAFAAACAEAPGVMAAVLRLDEAEVRRIVAAVENAHVANVNAPQQVVVSGSAEAVDQVRDRVDEAGGRVIDLDVEGPFHSPAMEPARRRVEAVLDDLRLRDPTVPFVSGTGGQLLQSAGEVRRALIDGVRSPVQWVAVQHTLADRVDHLVEVGPGRVLAGLARRTVSSLRRTTVSTPADVEALLEAASSQPDQTLVTTGTGT